MNILFFSPFSGIWEHSLPEYYVAQEFTDHGHKIHYLSCGQSFEYCHTLSGRGVGLKSQSASRKDICNNCFKTSQKITKELKCNLETIKEHSKTLNINQREVLKCLNNPYDYSFEGIDFGKIVLYDTILQFKKQSATLENDEEKEYFIHLLNNAFKSYHSIKSLLSTQGFDRVLIYSPQYSTNHVVAEYLVSKKIPVYFLEAGTNIPARLKTMRCWKWSTNQLVNPLLKSWPKSLEFNFTKEDINSVSRHYMSLLKAKSHLVYSNKLNSSWKFSEHFTESIGKKIILATMSSFDEAYAAYVAGLFPKNKAVSDVYVNQVEWIIELIEYIRMNSNLFLIVRVHPRDFPNRREKLVSEQGKKLLAVFDNLPKNVYINWPSENISIYDLYPDVDVVTTGWSITALEAGMLGIPVVTYDSNLPSYPASMMLSGRSKVEYFENLEKASKVGWSFNQVENSFRWLAFNHRYGSVRISETFDNFEANTKPLFFRIRDKVLRKCGMDPIIHRFLRRDHMSNNGLKIIRTLVESCLDNLMDVELNQPQDKIDRVSEYVSQELDSIYHLIESSKSKNSKFSVNKVRG